MTELPKLNKWSNTKNILPIGRNLKLRLLANNKVSLGIRYDGKRIKFNQTIDDLLQFIRKHHISGRRQLMQEYERSFSIEFVKAHFRQWDDVKHDLVWQQSVELHLTTLKYNLLRSTKADDIYELQNKTDITFNRTQQRQIINKQQQQIQIIEKQQQQMQRLNDKVIALEKRHINDINTIKEINNTAQRKMQGLQQRNTMKQKQIVKLKQSRRTLQCSKATLKYRAQKHVKSDFNVRKDISNCKRKKQVAGYRIARLLHRTSDLVTNEHASEVLTKHIQKHYPSYPLKQKQKATDRRNKELKKIEQRNADKQFRADIESGMTQRQGQSQRNHLFQSPKKRERYKTTDGTTTAGISSRSSKDQKRDKYIHQLIEDGTAFLPLMPNGLYKEYYQHKADIRKGNKVKIGPKNNLKKMAKDGIDGCGVSIGCVRDLECELWKRLHELVLDPKYSLIFAYHESNYLQRKEMVHKDLLELCITFDGSDSKHNRAGNARTQCHIYYGALIDGAAGYI